MLEKLSDLYLRIKNCNNCPGMDKEKAVRLIEAIDATCDVFIISQALAESQLRLSGVNFFNTQGLLGNTGLNLEKFLNKINRTVYPSTDVFLLNGVRIPKSKLNFKSVYNTETVQCYPGKCPKGDRKPTKDEVKTCLDKNFLLEEIGIIRPKLLLLMGRLSRDNFYGSVLKEDYPESLTRHIGGIVEKGIPVRKLNDNDCFILPIQHASGANPEFGKMLKDERLIGLINTAINP